MLNEQKDGYVIAPGPLLLTDGFQIAKDPAIEKIIKQHYTGPNTSPNPIHALYDSDYTNLMQAVNKLIDQLLANPATKIPPKIQQELKHYIDYFEEYLKHNKHIQEVVEKWQPIIPMSISR